jgi:hypothetical protein
MLKNIYRTETMNLGKAISNLNTRIKQVDRILYRFHQKENENFWAWRRASLLGYPKAQTDVADAISAEIDQMNREFDIVRLKREFARLNVLYDALRERYDTMLRQDVNNFLKS